MASAIIEDTMSETGHDLAAIVRAGCFVSEAEALREGRQFLQPAVALIESGKLSLLALTAKEVVAASRLPTSLNAGEAESIALCQSRSAAFVTNDLEDR